MSIKVKTSDVQANSPIKVTLVDHSAAHVILTLSIANQPPVTHAFDYNEGELTVPLDLEPGSYACSFTVQAFSHGAFGRMYSSALQINNEVAATVSGNITPPSSFDVGFGDFTLTVPTFA